MRQTANITHIRETTHKTFSPNEQCTSSCPSGAATSTAIMTNISFMPAATHRGDYKPSTLASQNIICPTLQFSLHLIINTHASANMRISQFHH